MISKNIASAISILSCAWAVWGASTEPPRPTTERSSSDGTFIFPNEIEMSRFASVVKGKEHVAVGVGTFRMIQLAALGDFEKVVLFDYDDLVTQFNREHIKLLAAAKNRKVYLSQIFEPSSFLRPSQACLIRTSFAQIASCGINDIEKIFFLNDGQFKKVRSFARAGGFHVMSGDLTGTKTMKDLARDLNRRKKRVSILDISNAHEYFSTRYEWANFVDNLKSLPWAADALLLLTASERLFEEGFIDDYIPMVDVTDAHERVQREADHNVSEFIYIAAAPEEFIRYAQRILNGEEVLFRSTGRRILESIAMGEFHLIEASCDELFSSRASGSGHGTPLFPADSKPRPITPKE